jgi:nucleoside-diphosphate-sugar epimerase
LPARFRRERLLIVGCGDVGMRVARALQAPGARPSESADLPKRAAQGVRIMALTSSAQRLGELRQAGVTPVLGNLDTAASLRRLAGLAHRVIHLAPPPGTGAGDPRTRKLLAALRLRSAPASFVYGSTSGVYGDCQGDIAAETRAVSAFSERARRRIDAEARVRHHGRATGTRVHTLRIPGIYALNRPYGTPVARLQKGTPVLNAEEDGFTNHIHADDLARACIAALWRGRPQRVYNVNDNTTLKMGDYFDLAADILKLPRPPRVSREVAKALLSAMQMSFMGESRRMDNTRMKRELRLCLRYATVADGLKLR